MRQMFVTLFLLLMPLGCRALEWRHGRTLRIECDTTTMEPAVGSALRMFGDDCRRVLGSRVEFGEEGDIVLRVDARRLKGRWEAFRIEVRGERLYVTGSDCHGLAFGLLEVSRMMGVSPWEWWADVTPRPLERFTLPKGFHRDEQPDVQFRGIFINDEDWGLLPWAANNYEPTDTKDRIGPRTHSRIFELLLRLRANTFWPAMHECTEPFFLCDANREVARRYGIYIGTSHCEPMACNVNGEWRRRGHGDYDYIHNSTEVVRFWEERVRDVASQPVLYTLGMRGVHDGAMQGARTVDEQRQVLERVLHDQREMLRRHVDADVSRIPQVFIPYKEVLDVYNSGLEVPDDVCLMWCDDNYGFIHHFPTASERRRSGGHGVYYHVSYWGRPHDYLWLGTFSPALLYQQMSLAYDHDMRRMWILNVGDLKPAEYQTQLFLDMAWDISRVRQQGVEGHLREFLAENLGSGERREEREMGFEERREKRDEREMISGAKGLRKKQNNPLSSLFSLLSSKASPLSTLLLTHYRLAYQCKPEFLGGTRVEEADRKYWNTVRDLPWTWEQIDERLQAYQRLEDEVERLSKDVPDDRREAFFQLVKYPVQAAAEMNKKMLLAQQARHGRASWQASRAAYDSIDALTRVYNNDKWLGIMDFRPRRLPVFMALEESGEWSVERGERNDNVSSLHSPLSTLHQEKPSTLQGRQASSGRFVPLELLGYEGGAVAVRKGRSITFDLPPQSRDTLTVEVRLLPNHAVEGDSLRFRLSLDGHTTGPVNYETYGRSEEWKQNVLRSQAIRRFTLPLAPGKKLHRLSLRALDEGIVLDQIAVY